MANILTPDFKLKIGTTDFSNQPNKRRVSEMTVEQLSDGASSFRIVLDDSDEAISDGKISILEGMECTVEMGFAESGTKQVIKGYVTGVKPKRSEFSRKMFTVTGFDGLSKLTRVVRGKTSKIPTSRLRLPKSVVYSPTFKILDSFIPMSFKITKTTSTSSSSALVASGTKSKSKAKNSSSANRAKSKPM